MEQDAYNALMMIFAVIVFIMALSITMFMLTKVTETSEVLAFYDDETNYYDNIEFNSATTNGIDEGTTDREVDFATLSAVLYRYYKENFCVKIYDATTSDKELLQVFDVNLEGLVHTAVSDSLASGSKHANMTPANNLKHFQNYSLIQAYNQPGKAFYLWGAPWLGSTNNDDQKLRVDLYLAGKAGYINGYRVDYSGNELYKKMVEDRNSQTKYKLIERFISYSYTGTSTETEEGDTIVTGGKASKDKILIIYTIENR